MRQDPEVILVGENRDTETVETVFQAALTGHLVISTFHAGSAAGAISRLLDMGIEPYLLTSGLRAVLHQRLLRRLCACSQELGGTVGSSSSASTGGTAGLSSSVQSTGGLSRSATPDLLGLPLAGGRQA